MGMYTKTIVSEKYNILRKNKHRNISDNNTNNLIYYQQYCILVCKLDLVTPLFDFQVF